MDARNLVAAARALNIRISPVAAVDGGGLVLSVADALSILRLLRATPTRTIEDGNIRGIIRVGHDRSDDDSCLLTVDEAHRLTRALRQIELALDRERRIARGQYVGPMSGSEAVKFMRRMHGLR